MALDDLILRPESGLDREAVARVNEAAFGRLTEARLVDALRETNAVALSLVAELDGRVVGHALFTSVRLGDTDPGRSGGALGPIAVLPDHQGRGIGGALVRRGLSEIQLAGYPACVLLGHSTYYPRFGFRPASAFGLRCKWPVPDAVFMAIELRDGALADYSGLVEYHPAFDQAT